MTTTSAQQKPRTSTWVTGLAGVLLTVAGVTFATDGSIWQVTLVLLGVALLVGSAGWALKERSYQAAIIWVVGAALGIAGVIAVTT